MAKTPRKPPNPNKPAPAHKTSTLEQTFIAYWQTFGVETLDSEYQFANPRRWRFDFAHVYSKTAIELEGGVWAGGRHTRGAGFIGDCEKYNVAVMEGWAVLRFTSDMLEKDPHGAVNQINELIVQRIEDNK